MTNEIMSVHKALAELKILGDKVEKSINTGIFCTENMNYSKVIGGMTIEDYKNKVIKASYDKTEDLLKRYIAIKNAVNESNAKTEIEVGNAKMTIAVAIWMKNQGMLYKEQYLEKLKNQFSSSQRRIETNNAGRMQRADEYVIKKYGMKEGKVSDVDVTKEKENYINDNTMTLIDPCNIAMKITMLESEIDSFNAEIDAAISVSNALTQIEISY